MSSQIISFEIDAAEISQESFRRFVTMIAERRGISEEDARKLAIRELGIGSNNSLQSKPETVIGLPPSEKRYDGTKQKVWVIKKSFVQYPKEYTLKAGRYEVCDGLNGINEFITLKKDYPAVIISEEGINKFVQIKGDDTVFKVVEKKPEQLSLELEGSLIQAAENDNYDTEMALGEKVEREHAGTIEKLLKEAAPNLSAEEVEEIIDEAVVLIAKDHLKEMGDYYSKLKVMEDSSNEKVKSAEEKSQEVNEPVRKDNFNLFNTDMPDACPTDVFSKGYDTVRPPDSGDDPQALFNK